MENSKKVTISDCQNQRQKAKITLNHNKNQEFKEFNNIDLDNFKQLSIKLTKFKQTMDTSFANINEKFT